MKSKMHERYLIARHKYRNKYGRVTSSDFLKRCNENDTLLKDTVEIAYLLGEWRSQHRRNIKSRKYQSVYRIKHRDKVRTYQRDYKRKIRGSKAFVYSMPKQC